MAIILISGKAGCGKDTAADHIVDVLNKNNQKTMKIAFANHLKYLAKQYFGWNGEKDAAGRSLLQTLGTDLIRNQYNEDFWVDNVADIIEIAKNFFDYQHFIISDWRFINEVNFIETIFGYLKIIKVRIERPQYDKILNEEQEKHPSENDLDGFNFDYILINNGSLEDYANNLTYFLNKEGLLHDTSY